MATTVTTPKVGDCRKPAVDAKALWYRTGVIIPTEQPRVRWTTEKFSESAPDCEAKSVRPNWGQEVLLSVVVHTSADPPSSLNALDTGPSPDEVFSVG